MCNRLHSYSKPIPEFGEGWKVFTKERDGSLHQWVFSYGLNGQQLIDDYKKKIDDWCVWRPDLVETHASKDGFCFLIDRKAIEAFSLYIGKHKDSYTVIRKIKYRGGLGHHMDSGTLGFVSIDIALCKEFKVIEE